MAATTVGALLIVVAAAIWFWAARTAPERRQRSPTPLQDAYAADDAEESGSADEQSTG